MEESKVLILGAGPSGLAAGFELHRGNETFSIIERNDSVGGLSRTFEYGKFRTDVGPHRFFSQNSYLYDLIEDLLGAHWIKVNRLTRFFINGKYFLYPINLTNAMLNLGIFKGLRILFDYISEKIKNKFSNRNLISFQETIIAEFGKSLAELNMLNYTEKIWGLPCSIISPDWYSQRIKGLSLISVAKNLFFNAKGKLKTLVDQFYYPDIGTGLIYETMNSKIIDGSNGIIKTNSYPVKIIHDNHKITEVIVKENGKNQLYNPNYIISSIPWEILLNILDPQPPKDILQALKMLKYRSHVSLFITLNKHRVFSDQWQYFPESEIPFGRIMEPKNFSEKMSPTDKTSLLLEFFCWENDKYWNMDKRSLLKISLPWLEKLKYANEEEIIDCYIHREKYAYPVYDLYYNLHREKIKDFLNQFKNLQLIGRLGNFRYNNQDHALESGILAARNIIEGNKYNLEDIGTEQKYFERGYLKNYSSKNSKIMKAETTTKIGNNIETDSNKRTFKLNEKKESSEPLQIKMFLSYIFFAGIATLVDMSILFILTDYLLMYYLISAIYAYLCGMIINYLLNKYLTFKNKDKRVIHQFSVFAFVALVGLGLNELILFIAVEFFGIWYLYSKLISVCIVVFWSFFGHKKLTFNIIK